MIVKFNYINERLYVNNESFIRYIFSSFKDISSMSFRFNKITNNNICEFNYGPAPYDKKTYNVTGELVIHNRVIYFGFIETESSELLETTLDENVSLNDVSIPDMGWVFTSYFKKKCEEFYDKSSEKLLMASVEFENLDTIGNMNNFSFEIRNSGKRLHGFFNSNGIIICKELMLVRDK